MTSVSTNVDKGGRGPRLKKPDRGLFLLFLSKHWIFKHLQSEKCTVPCSGRRARAQNAKTYKVDSSLEHALQMRIVSTAALPS